MLTTLPKARTIYEEFMDPFAERTGHDTVFALYVVIGPASKLAFNENHAFAGDAIFEIGNDSSARHHVDGDDRSNRTRPIRCAQTS